MGRIEYIYFMIDLYYLRVREIIILIKTSFFTDDYHKKPNHTR